MIGQCLKNVVSDFNAHYSKKLHEHLLLQYHIRGFKNIVEVGGSYSERLNTALLEIGKIMKTEV